MTNDLSSFFTNSDNQIWMKAVDAHLVVKRIDINISRNEKWSIVVEHLVSQKCFVIDLLDPDAERQRIETIYYDSMG